MKVCAGAESWKECKNNFIRFVNLHQDINYVGIKETINGDYVLVYKKNGKLTYTHIYFQTKGISMPFRPCLKTMKAYLSM